MWTRQFAAYVLVTAAGLMIISNMRGPLAASQAAPRQFWEYKSIIEISQNDIAISDNGLLNQAGLVGWELSPSLMDRRRAPSSTS